MDFFVLFFFFLLFRTLLPLPGRDDEGRKVIIIRATIHDPNKHKQDDVFKVCLSADYETLVKFLIISLLFLFCR